MELQLNKLLDPLRRKIRNMLGKVLVDELQRTGKVQVAQVVTEGGGALAGVEYIEPFGFTGSPPDGKHPGVYCRPNGDGSQTILICIDGREYRLEIDADESAIYNSQGDYAHVKNNGEVHVKASVRVLAETPLFETSADCLVQGNLTVQGQTQHVGAVQNMSTTQMMQTATVEAGGFVSNAPTVFNAAAGFVAGITANGVNIGADHDHSGGNEQDGSTGPVRAI